MNTRSYCLSAFDVLRDIRSGSILKAEGPLERSKERCRSFEIRQVQVHLI